MKKGMGAHKGSGWERAFCRELSLWWTKGETKNAFWRTHASGARGTMVGTLGGLGDVLAMSSEAKDFTDLFVVELKFYKKVDTAGLLEKKSKNLHQILQWWEKVKNEAYGVGRYPMLVVKQNNRLPQVFVCRYFPLFFSNGDWFNPCAWYHIDLNLVLVVCGLSSFFQLDPKMLIDQKKRLLLNLKPILDKQMAVRVVK